MAETTTTSDLLCTDCRLAAAVWARCCFDCAMARLTHEWRFAAPQRMTTPVHVQLASTPFEDRPQAP
jgi:hypothetical protein